MKDNISKSKEMREEYCASIVRVGKLKDIEGADNLKKTVINGFDIVVNKNDVHEGDVMIYFKNETRVCDRFLRENCMFEDSTLNADSSKRGYVSKNGRIRMITLRGCPSYGILVSPESFEKCWPGSMKDIESLIKIDKFGNPIAFDFDTVCGEKLIDVYIPVVSVSNNTKSNRRRDVKIRKMSRMIPGEFSFHYDTRQLNSNMHTMSPDDEVCISVKLHGTSAVFGNVKVKAPMFGGLYSKIFTRLPRILQFTRETYDDIYSSRSVIKNKDINCVGGGFYGEDVWSKYHKILKGKIPEGVTLYGEIVGFTPGESPIQKRYDYGCKQGESMLYIYRVSDNGRELDPVEVREFVDRMLLAWEDLRSHITVVPNLFTGRLKDLYPEIAIDEFWQSNVLSALKREARFGMDQQESLCVNKVPREGIVIRKINREKAAFKLKCNSFMKREANEVDAGIIDVEMSESY